MQHLFQLYMSRPCKGFKPIFQPKVLAGLFYMIAMWFLRYVVLNECFFEIPSFTHKYEIPSKVVLKYVT